MDFYEATIYQTDEEDFTCMDLDGEGAVIYGIQSYNGESPTSDDVFQHVKGCKRRVNLVVEVCARGARVASNSTQQQWQRASMWDHMKDAEVCLIECGRRWSRAQGRTGM